MNTHDRIREGIAAHTLLALDEDERRRVEQELLEHLPGCAECSAAMREFREAAGDLALGVDPVPPSGELDERLLSAVRGEPRKRQATPIVSRRRRLAGRAGVAAAVVALVASAALNVALVQRVDEADRDRAALAALVDAASDPRVRSVALRGEAGSVVLVYRPEASAVLVAEALGAPPAGHVYELWFLDGSAVPVETFVPEEGRVVLALPKNPTGFRGAAITIEKGFVQKPTVEPLYSATLEA